MKYQNKVQIVGTVTHVDTEMSVAVISTAFDKKAGGQTVHRHVVKLYDGAEVVRNERVKVQGKLLTLHDEEGKEIETIVQALTIAETNEPLDSARASVIGQTVRPADIYDRNPERGNKPFANLRMKVGPETFVWVKAWNSLYQQFKQHATKGSIVQMVGNLGYQFIGENGIKLTEIVGNDTQTSRVLMKAAIVDEFAGFVEDEEEAIDVADGVQLAPVGRMAMATTAMDVAEDDIPF